MDMDYETGADLSALRAQAAALGVAVDGRWSEDTLRQKIDAATAPEPAAPAPGEKPLHVLNAEARAAYAAAFAGQQVAYRNGRRVQKNLRAPIE